MTLSIIGSGFGRTGTKSIKEAIEQLGFGPCHHMYELVENPDTVQGWQDAADGVIEDWANLYAGYKSQVDWPGSHYWRQVAEAFPEAKVLHSVRPEDSWVRSFQRTIGKLMTVYEGMNLPPHIRAILDMNKQIISEGTFGGSPLDEDVLRAAFRKRTEDVLAAIPEGRVLVFDPADGWEPLCAFLDVPVPDQPFPHKNLRADFWEVLGLSLIHI